MKLFSWRTVCAITLLSSALLLPFQLSAQERESELIAQPFNYFDMNPLTRIFGSPQAALPAYLQSGEVRWQLHTSISNTLHIENEANEMLLLDAETQHTNLSIAYGLRNWDLRIDLPLVSLDSGSLDGGVDSFHTSLGLSQGLRPQVPENQFNIQYVVDGVEQINLSQGVSGLGDVSLSLVRGLNEFTAEPIYLGLKLELPTGDEDELLGSGSTDVSLWLNGQAKITESIAHYAGISATYIGGKGLFQEVREDAFYTLVYGLHWRAAQGFALKAQFDFQNRLFKDTDTRLLDYSSSILLGGTFYLGRKYELDVGIAEDVDVDTSPDFTVLINLRKHFGA